MSQEVRGVIAWRRGAPVEVTTIVLPEPGPAATVVRTGHGDSTTIGAEAPHLPEWLARGH